MKPPEWRAEVLRSFGASGAELAELLRYNESRFDFSPPSARGPFPLPDESSVATWEGYAAEAASVSAIEALRPRLAPLNFPIAAGIGETEDYRAATRRGEPPGQLPSATGLELLRPGDIELFIHPTPAGRVPILAIPSREDFLSIYRALAMRNEPRAVPDSVKAAMIAGINNWDRVRALRAAWEAERPTEAAGEGWSEHFRERIVPDKSLYQDRVILLNDGPYSGVAAGDVGMGETEWLRVSRAIRLEHECAHYFTRRALGAMSNNLLDEIIADYMGIHAGAGRFRADWFLRFMGLENYPAYRESGRLGHYRGDPPLGDEAFKILQALASAAARNLESFDRARGAAKGTIDEKARAILALASMTVEEMACERGAELIGEAWRRECRI